MRRLPYFAMVLLALTAGVAACAGTPVAVAPRPAAASRPTVPSAAPASTKATGAVALPPISLVDGPLNIKVVYPRPNQEIQVRDSNFIFGSVGSGKATLSINGYDVPVAPNGAFLGFIPVPRGEKPAYELVAINGAEKSAVTAR
jgi:N-acetylmuramoyl-L-alanine amidase